MALSAQTTLENDCKVFEKSIENIINGNDASSSSDEKQILISSRFTEEESVTVRAPLSSVEDYLQKMHGVRLPSQQSHRPM